MNTSPLLEINNLSHSYEQKIALSSINLKVNSGDFLAIIGPNGGGKSTLIKLIMGLIPIKEGSIKLFGKSVKNGRNHVGYLPQIQNAKEDFPITVEDVVALSRLKNKWLLPLTKQDYKIANHCLAKVEISHLGKRTLDTLSGGEKQRVYLARALVNSPKLLILDEPTTSVDIQAERSIYTLLKELNKTLAIVIVSHDLSAVPQLVNKIACLNKKLIFHENSELSQNDLEEVYGCPVSLITHGVHHHHLHAHD